MHILYMPRAEETRKRNRRRWRRRFMGHVDGPEGFFEAALHRACRVTRLPYEQAIALPAVQRGAFDAVIVNSRSGLPWMEDTAAALRDLRAFRQPVSFFNSHDKAEAMGEDALLDRFKVIFKREPLADLSGLGISEENAAKVVPTHLSNPMVSMSYRFQWRNRVRPLPRYGWQGPHEHDLFFIGTVNHTRYRERIAAWQAIRGSNLDYIGGLLPKRDFTSRVPAELVTTPLPKAEYLKVMMQSRINLAIEGIGPFTFRHLEQFWAGAFTLSTASLRRLRLRAPLVEDRDYVAFDDADEMMDKIRWYLDHEAERTEIARNGRAAYEILHDVDAHAAEIRRALEA